MDSAALALIQAGAIFSLTAYVFSRGLSTRLRDLTYFVGRWGTLLSSLFTVDVLVPLITIGVVGLVRPANATAIGLLLLAASPAAPMILKKIVKAGGDREYAVSLYVVLASLAVITIPLTLAFLSITTGLQLEVSPPAVAQRVGLSILVPLAAGLLARELFPALAARIVRPLEAVSIIILYLVLGLVLLTTFPLLLALDLRSYAAMALTIVGALAAGHLVASGQRGEQITLGIESATRNAGLALLIASAYAPLEKALPILIPYMFTGVVVNFFYLRYLKLTGGARNPTAT